MVSLCLQRAATLPAINTEASLFAPLAPRGTCPRARAPYRGSPTSVPHPASRSAGQDPQGRGLVVGANVCLVGPFVLHSLPWLLPWSSLPSSSRTPSTSSHYEHLSWAPGGRVHVGYCALDSGQALWRELGRAGLGYAVEGTYDAGKGLVESIKVIYDEQDV